MAAQESQKGDLFNLSRFVTAQTGSYDTALSELRHGQKESHWMWFIFPQLDGLGHSSMAREFAIKSLDEARAYLNHPVLGPRLLACCQALLSVSGKSASEVMGFPDDLKLRSSMTLFSLVACAPSEFKAVLDKYFQGRADELTVDLLKVQSPKSSSK